MSNPYIVDPGAPDAEKRIDYVWEGAPEGDAYKRNGWVKAKRLLSEGEHRRMMKSISTISQPVLKKGETGTPTAKFEWTDYSFARMEAYLTDWSLAHDSEPSHRLPIGRTSYEKLQRDLFEVIDNALDTHEVAQAEAKKTPAGSPVPEAISA